MKLIANEVNNNYFLELVSYVERAACIDIAVAYITDKEIFELAQRHNKPLNIWCRIDEDVNEKTLSLLHNIMFYEKAYVRATYDFLHSKVIWFHGVGCYVGSANITTKAFYKNIELGVFFEEDVDGPEIFDELKTFFENLSVYTSPLTKHDIKRIQQNFADRDNDDDVKRLSKELADAKRKYIDIWDKLKETIFKGQKQPLREQSGKTLHQKRVIEEWKSCHILLTNYMHIYKNEYQRPKWVNADLPYFAEMDRMFCWYYEGIKGNDRALEAVIKHHEKNKDNPELHTRALFKEWSSSPDVPDDFLLESFNERVPIVKRYLAKDKITYLTNDELAEVVYYCYALMDHIDQFKSLESLGLIRGDSDLRVPREEKARQYVERYLQGANGHGKTFLEILSYFIWNNSWAPWEKIWECTDKNSKWKYPGIDKSTLGELIGLARPDEYPVRNNRVSRALYALGFDVDHN